ncbi:hypothetical protein D3C81_1730670 [compost metagenome]
MAGHPVPDFNAVKCAADVAIAHAECDELQATIERQAALLREALELIDDGVGCSDFEWALIQKLRDATAALNGEKP